jgi:hypothetical protein
MATVTVPTAIIRIVPIEAAISGVGLFSGVAVGQRTETPLENVLSARG